MLIYFWVVLVISPAGFLEDLIGCSAIRIISDSYHIVNISKCMCSQNKVIHSLFIHSKKTVNSVVKCKRPSEYIILDYMYHVKSTNGQKVDMSEVT